VIPKIRGRFRSRTIESLVREARGLALQGVREITLVSQDTTSYGVDLGIQDGLAELLEALAAIEGIYWIRFLYVYPTFVSDRLIEVVASHPKICKYVDMPLQHASAGVLKAMRRGGNAATLARLVDRIRAAIPDVTMRTTMIVGFPGETDEDFSELQSFCKELEFDRLGVFTYSDEEDTAAFTLARKVPAEVAEERRKTLMKQQAKIASRKNRSLIGQERTILIEGTSPESDLLLQGRMESQAPEIDGVCLINDSQVGDLQVGEFRRIRISRALEHDLLGTIVR
jgi:ribosomal protein S12 methylthiotransferase